MIRKLTPKQERFVDEYLKDLNATQAAIRAGYSPKNADNIASELLGKTHVYEAISRKRRAMEEECGITRSRVIQEMARLAFFNSKNFFDKDGNPIPINQLSDDAAAAINGLDVVSIGNNEIGLGQVLKYKIPDKNKALENLSKILGYLDRDRQKEQDSATLLAQAMAQFASKINGN